MANRQVAPVVGVAAAVFAILLFTFSCARSTPPDRNGEEAANGEVEERSPSGRVVEGVRVVEVAARQFEFEPSTIVVRQGEDVRLEVTSEDVPHGIGIEALDIDRELPPNETQTIEFTADEPGQHRFHCSVYCGEGHGDMAGELVVLEDANP